MRANELRNTLLFKDNSSLRHRNPLHEPPRPNSFLYSNLLSLLTMICSPPGPNSRIGWTISGTEDKGLAVSSGLVVNRKRAILTSSHLWDAMLATLAMLPLSWLKNVGLP